MRSLDEDELLRRTEVVEHPHDLDVEPLRLGSLEDGEAVALHAFFDLGRRDRARVVVAVRPGDEREERHRDADEDRQRRRVNVRGREASGLPMATDRSEGPGTVGPMNVTHRSMVSSGKAFVKDCRSARVGVLTCDGGGGPTPGAGGDFLRKKGVGSVLMSIDRELDELLAMGDRVVAHAKKGGADVAETIFRSGAELSVRVRLGKPELVEEAGTRSAGLRVIKGGRVASTSTSDLSDAGLHRFVEDALELAELCQRDEFAGPADPAELCDPKAAKDLDLYDPAGGSIDAKTALDYALRGEKAALDVDPRLSNSEGASFGRVAGGSAIVLSSGFRAAYKGSYQSLSVVPLAEDEGGKKRRGYHWTAKRHLSELDTPEAVGAEAARRTLRKLGAKTVATCEVPVVFDPDAARSILGLLAGCVMGGSIWRKSSYLVGRHGARRSAHHACPRFASVRR